MDSFMLYYLLGHWKAGPRKIATFVCNWGKFGHNHALICLARMPTFQSDMIPFLALRHRPCNVAGKTFPVLLRPIVFELQGNFHRSWRHLRTTRTFSRVNSGHHNGSINEIHLKNKLLSLEVGWKLYYLPVPLMQLIRKPILYSKGIFLGQFVCWSGK